MLLVTRLPIYLPRIVSFSASFLHETVRFKSPKPRIEALSL